MRRILLSAAAAYLAIAGIAQAQTIVSQTTTTTTSPVAPMTPAPIAPTLPPPPVGTLSTTRTQYSLQPDGTQTKTNETTYRNSTGVADDSVTRTVTVPPPVTTSTSNYSMSTTTIKK